VADYDEIFRLKTYATENFLLVALGKAKKDTKDDILEFKKFRFKILAYLYINTLICTCLGHGSKVDSP